jgi:hypothetical protein
MLLTVNYICLIIWNVTFRSIFGLVLNPQRNYTNKLIEINYDWWEFTFIFSGCAINFRSFGANRTEPVSQSAWHLRSKPPVSRCLWKKTMSSCQWFLDVGPIPGIYHDLPQHMLGIFQVIKTPSTLGNIYHESLAVLRSAIHMQSLEPMFLANQPLRRRRENRHHRYDIISLFFL